MKMICEICKRKETYLYAYKTHMLCATCERAAKSGVLELLKKKEK